MNEPEAHRRYAFGPFVLLPGQRQLIDADGERVVLRGLVFDLLLLLIENRGRVVGKSELLETLWPDTVVEENNLNQTASALRQALGDDPRAPRYIATVRGRGYQFVGDLRSEEVREASGREPPRTAASSRKLPLFLLAAAVLSAFVIWLTGSGQRPQPPPDTPVVEAFAEAAVRLVTERSGSHTSPTLSPDGRMIAYVSNADGTPQLWIRNLERGDPLRITDMPFPVGHPSWSPDDDEILFHEATPDGVSIYSVGTLGTPKPRKIVESGYGANFSAGSDAFVFARNKEVWLAQKDGRDLRRVREIPKTQGFAPPAPALSPDGTRIVFVLADEGPLGSLWLISAAGGDARRLTQPDTSGGYATEPAWTPDGRYVVYSAFDPAAGDTHLWRVDVASGEAVKLTSGAGGASNPVVSADGERLAFTIVRTEHLLTRIDLADGERSNVFTSRRPVVLPEFERNGSRVVYFSNAEAGGQVFLVSTDGSEPEQLTFGDGAVNILPAWTGNEHAVLYYAGRSLHQVSPESGLDEQVFTDFHWSSRNWLNAYGDKVAYHETHRPTGDKRTVVRSLGEGEEIELAVPIEAARWSPDGAELVGFFRKTGEIMICTPGEATCRVIESGGDSLTGYRPTWSADGGRIYFLQQTGDGKCCDLQVIDRNGAGHTRLATLHGFNRRDSNYAVRNGAVFYNHIDTSSEEIWLAVVDAAAAGEAAAEP
jgi:Tol biopolymer transport system component/DNA-binding winged helix-turn-helix (wHTH) protein